MKKLKRLRVAFGHFILHRVNEDQLESTNGSSNIDNATPGIPQLTVTFAWDKRKGGRAGVD